MRGFCCECFSGGQLLRQLPCSLGHNAIALTIFVGTGTRIARVAVDASPPYPRGDRGEPEHREHHEDIERIRQRATGVPAVAFEEGWLIGKSCPSEVLTGPPASATRPTRHVVGDAEIAEVGQRVADRRQFPVQHRYHSRL